MGKYSQLAEELLKAHKFRSPADAEPIVEEAATALRELEAERDRLRKALQNIKEVDPEQRIGGISSYLYAWESCHEIARAELERDRLRRLVGRSIEFVSDLRDQQKAKFHGFEWQSNLAAIDVYLNDASAAPSPEWVIRWEREPTREDADEHGKVWAFVAGKVILEDWHMVFDLKWWMPKPRQQPPEPPEGE